MKRFAIFFINVWGKYDVFICHSRSKARAFSRFKRIDVFRKAHFIKIMEIDERPLIQSHPEEFEGFVTNLP